MGTGQPTEPGVFVSHSHANNAYCREFVAALRKGLNDADNRRKLVWYDESNMTEGELLRKIQPEIYARPIFIVMLSPASLYHSNWVNTESLWAFGYYMRDRRTHRFLPVTVETLASDDFGPDWVFLQGMLRIEGPGRTPLPPHEAAQRALAIIHEMPDFQPVRAPASSPTPQAPHQQPVHTPTPSPARPLVVQSPSCPPVAQQPSPAASVIPPERFPQRLATLGFTARKDRAGVEYILPPVVPVPAGPFLMGDDLKPNMPMEFFQIAAHPVTVAEYACFVNKGHAKPQDWDRQLKKLDHPVVYVSWFDAFDYAVWLVDRTEGRRWRLATEAEWEKAARGTDGRIYPWGDTFDPNRCNTSESGIGGTTAVGTYASGAADGRSSYGVYDMAGNVWEWTGSIYTQGYSQSSKPVGRNFSGSRSLRGGSWYFLQQHARAAYRLTYGPELINDALGFRLVLAP